MRIGSSAPNYFYTAVDNERVKARDNSESRNTGGNNGSVNGGSLMIRRSNGGQMNDYLKTLYAQKDNLTKQKSNLLSNGIKMGLSAEEIKERTDEIDKKIEDIETAINKYNLDQMRKSLGMDGEEKKDGSVNNDKDKETDDSEKSASVMNEKVVAGLTSAYSSYKQAKVCDMVYQAAKGKKDYAAMQKVGSFGSAIVNDAVGSARKVSEGIKEYRKSRAKVENEREATTNYTDDKSGIAVKAKKEKQMNSQNNINENEDAE